jgi:hypothetical protein
LVHNNDSEKQQQRQNVPIHIDSVTIAVNSSYILPSSQSKSNNPNHPNNATLVNVSRAFYKTNRHTLLSMKDCLFLHETLYVGLPVTINYNASRKFLSYLVAENITRQWTRLYGAKVERRRTRHGGYRGEFCRAIRHLFGYSSKYYNSVANAADDSSFIHAELYDAYMSEEKDLYQFITK